MHSPFDLAPAGGAKGGGKGNERAAQNPPAHRQQKRAKLWAKLEATLVTSRPGKPSANFYSVQLHQAGLENMGIPARGASDPHTDKPN